MMTKDRAEALPEEIDDLDALLADILPEDAEGVVGRSGPPVAGHGVPAGEGDGRMPAHPARIGVGVTAIVLGNPEMTESVRSARESCRDALDAVMRARDVVGLEVVTAEQAAVNAWLACMDELIEFCDRLCGVLLAEG